MNPIFRCLLVLLVIVPATTIAQDRYYSTDTTTVPRIDIGEVVVNASKNQSRLRDLPASVTLLPAEGIRQNEIRSLVDVTSSVPNFYMPDYGSKLTAPVYIRGIGSRIDAPSVGLYVDHVPYFEKASFNFDFFDISGIEVLRGPQGTLYGRNTMAGIVNILTLSPANYQGTKINLSAGSYGTYNLNGGHYAKASDKLAWSLTGNYQHNNGFYSNRFTGDKVDELDSYGFRNKVIWQPATHWTIENILSYENSAQGGYPYAVLNSATNRPNPIDYNQYSSYGRSLLSDALLVKLSKSRWELRLTTSYQLLDDNQQIDQDFTSDSLYFVAQKQFQQMVSHEAVARSKGDGRYQWLTGLYGLMQFLDKDVDVDDYARKTLSLKSYNNRVGGIALFHQSTLNHFLIRNLSLTAGIRVDYEKSSLDYHYRLRKGGAATTTVTDTLYPPLSYTEVLPKIALNYVAGQSNFYAVVAKGYKTGGFNSTFERPEDLTFKPEKSWNYEIGVKTSFLNRMLYADVALFYIDWKDQQIYQTVPSGRGSMLKNAGLSESKGIELSLKSASWHGFEGTVSYGYTEATFIKNVLNATTDYSGNYIPYVPRHTLALQLNKSIAIRNSKLLDEIKVNALYRETGIAYWNEANSHAQPAYGTTDLKLSLKKGDVRVEFWGRNVFDIDYESFYFEALGRKYVQPGKPARLGVNISIDF